MIVIKELTIADYDGALKLWQSTNGVCNCPKCALLDLPENIEKFLNRNKGLSFAAVDGNELVGVLLCGHDGRTGMIYRLTVSEKRQRGGIGKQLVEKAVEGLKQDGITDVKVEVLNDNENGNAFWEKVGFAEAVTSVTRHRQIL